MIDIQTNVLETVRFMHIRFRNLLLVRIAYWKHCSDKWIVPRISKKCDGKYYVDAGRLWIYR